MPALKPTSPTTDNVLRSLATFTGWLKKYGETSWDHQSYYAGPIGSRAKGLYYKNKLLGTAAVAPMVFSEGFLPGARRLFHQRIRLPIADAHRTKNTPFFILKKYTLCYRIYIMHF